MSCSVNKTMINRRFNDIYDIYINYRDTDYDCLFSETFLFVATTLLY